MQKKIEEMTDRELLVYEADLGAQFQTIQKSLQDIRLEFNKRIREEINSRAKDTNVLPGE